MSLMISDEVLQAAKMTEGDLRREIAVLLFQQERITLGKASTLVGMNQIEFQRLLSDRDICIHYDVADYEADIQSLRYEISARVTATSERDLPQVSEAGIAQEMGTETMSTVSPSLKISSV